MIGARWRVEGLPDRDIDPHWLALTLTPAGQARLRGRLFARQVARLPFCPVESLQSEDEMRDVAAVGDDYRQSRLYQYYLRRMETGMPCWTEGGWLDTEEKARDAYLRYLKLYRSMQQHGYLDDRDDPVAIAITANGDFRHLHGGTVRLAAARLLKLPSLRVRIATIDIDWALRCADRTGDPASSKATPGKATAGKASLGKVTEELLLAQIDDLIRAQQALPAPPRPVPAAAMAGGFLPDTI